MAEHSHRDEMNAAIRAQRERHAAPRTIAPADEPAPAEAPEPDQTRQQAPPESTEPRRKSLFGRLRGR